MGSEYETIDNALLQLLINGAFQDIRLLLEILTLDILFDLIDYHGFTSFDFHNLTHSSLIELTDPQLWLLQTHLAIKSHILSRLTVMLHLNSFKRD